VQLFPFSSNYDQLANYYLFTDLDKAVESSKLAVKLADSEGRPFYQKKLNNFYGLHDSVRDGNPFNGYLTFLRTEPPFSDRTKIDLITSILEKYPQETNGREELLSFKKSLP